MKFLPIATILISGPALAQSAPPAVNYGAAPGGQIVAPVNVSVPTQNLNYPVQVPQPAGPAPSGSRCVITGYGQQSTGQGSFGGIYTVGGAISCPL